MSHSFMSEERRTLGRLTHLTPNRIIKLLILIVIIAAILIIPPAIGVNAQQYYQVILGGLFAGGTYVIVATGLTLILGVMKIVNICHGDFVILAAYVSFWMSYYGLDPLISIVISVPLLFAIGVPLQRFLFSPGLKTGLDAPLLVAFGISNILQYSMQTAWTANPRAITASYSAWVLQLDGIVVVVLRATIVGVAVLLLLIMTVFLRKTYTGMAIRATAMDWEVASHFGINIERVNILAYAIGLSLAGVAGTLIGLVFGFDPASGIPYLLKAFAAIILGGVGSIPGALVGGIILGFVESVGSQFIGGQFRDAIAYIVFFVVLLLRPTGILAKVRTF